MALPTITPASTTSVSILPETGSSVDVNGGCSFGVYSDTTSHLYSSDFVSGAVDQVTFTYRKLGGDVLDIELKTKNIYAAYEEATLEYSSIINSHQAKNVLYTALGSATGSFDQDGLLKSGSTLSSSLSGTYAALKYPKFKVSYSRRVAKEFSGIASLNGYDTIYSGSFDTITGIQDYDLQAAISSSAATSGYDFSGKVGNKRIEIKRVYYKTPAAMWKFFGYYGGLNVVGNLMSYGQYSDDSTFELVPVWQNRLQAKAYEEAIYVRGSHFTYELRNNKLRIFPKPNTDAGSPLKFWFTFTIPDDSVFEEDTSEDTGENGVNNANTLPFEHLPFSNINSIGKMWIKKYALSLSKEMLAHVRGKFDKVPLPNDAVVLNSAELYSQAKEEQKQLKDDLKAWLDELVYSELEKKQADMMDSVNRILSKMPMCVYRG